MLWFDKIDLWLPSCITLYFHKNKSNEISNENNVYNWLTILKNGNALSDKTRFKVYALHGTNKTFSFISSILDWNICNCLPKGFD